jgi:hypothetical protein
MDTLETGAILAFLVVMFSSLALRHADGDELPRTAFSFTAADFDRNLDGDELPSLAETIPVGIFGRRSGLGLGFSSASNCADGNCAAASAPMAAPAPMAASHEISDSSGRRFLSRGRRLFGRIRGFFRRRGDRIHQRRSH